MQQQAIDSKNAAGLEVEEVEDDFDEIEKLQGVGVNMADIKKLKASGIYTVKGVWYSVTFVYRL